MEMGAVDEGEREGEEKRGEEGVGVGLWAAWDHSDLTSTTMGHCESDALFVYLYVLTLCCSRTRTYTPLIEYELGC